MQTGETLAHEFYDYDGPVELAKKGSDQAKAAATGAGKLADQASTNSTADQATRTDARTQAAPFVSSLMATKPGQLSPYSQAEYESQKTADASSAMDSRALGAKAASLRGFGSTPGTSASIINTTNRTRDANDTTAHQAAMRDTLGQGLSGVGYLQNQQNIYDPNRALQTGVSARGTQANAAQVMNQSPTLAGSIGQGIGTLAGAAGSVMTGLGGIGVKV